MTDTVQLTGTLEDYQSKVQELTIALDGLDKSSQEYANTLAQLQELNRQWAESIGTSTEKTQDLKNTVTETAMQGKTDMSSLSSAVLGVIPGLNTLNASWKAFQASMMTNPWIAIITVALTAIIGLFKTFKSAIEGNEQTSMKWKKAMATLQPVINAIKNAIDWLATAFVNMTSWVMDRIPGLVKSMGGWAKSWLEFVANVVDALTWVPRQISKMWQAIVPMMIEGIRKVATPLKKLFDAVGLEDWSKKIDSALTSISNSTVNLAANIESSMLGAGNSIRNLGTTINNAMNNFSASMEHSRTLQEKQNKLTMDARDANVKLAESEERLTKARREYNEAYAKHDDKAAKEALVKIEAEANKQAEISVNIEQRRLSLLQDYAKLTSNSAADNDAINKQQVAVIKAQTKAQQQLVMASRLRTRLEKQINSDGKKATEEQQKRLNVARKAEQDAIQARQKELAEATKAEAKATEEDIKQSKDLLKATEDRTKQYANDYKEFDKYERLKVELAKQMGVLTKKQRVDYENDRYKNEQELYKKQLDEYSKLLDDANVLDADKERVRVQIHETTLTAMNARMQHEVNIAKINAEELQRTINSLKSELNTTINEAKTNVTRETVERQTKLITEYETGKISYSKFVKELETINEEHSKRISEIEIERANKEATNAKTVRDEAISNVQTRYTEIAKIVETKEKELRELEQQYAEHPEDTELQERIAKTTKDYNTLRAIYESGENGITNILTTLLNARNLLLNDSPISDEMQNYINELANFFNIDESAMSDNINSMLQNIVQTLGINLDQLLALQQDYYAKSIDAQKKAADQRVKNIKTEGEDAQKQTVANQKAFTKLTNQMSKTMSVVSDYWEESISQRLEAGEISKEQAEEEFERLKQFNIAQAVVDTIAGSLSAYMSVWKEASLPLWSKIAMSVLLGAQTLASGYTQIKKIQSQTLQGASAESGGVQGSVTNVIVGSATPILNEAQDINNLNAMDAVNNNAQQQDIRVYVVESDITEAQNRTRARVVESSF